MVVLVKLLNVLSACRDYGLGKFSTFQETGRAIPPDFSWDSPPLVSIPVLARGSVTESGRRKPRGINRIGPGQGKYGLGHKLEY